MRKLLQKHTTALVVTGLFLLSAVIYLVQYAFFHDSRDTLFYMLQDWAFLPAQIAVVTIVLGGVMAEREKRDRLAKTQMLASSFFFDLGTEMLNRLLARTDMKDLKPMLHIDPKWQEREFLAAEKTLRTAEVSVRCRPSDFAELKLLLAQKRLSMLVIASNPSLLEHEDFTDMLWAIFHLGDELNARLDFSALQPEDAVHLNEDVARVVREIMVNWLCHMSHIRQEYPYLFLLEAAKNPLVSVEGEGVPG